MKERERKRLVARAGIVFWALLFITASLVLRLFNVQVRTGAALAAKAGREQSATFEVSGRRGDIVDRFGQVFAASVPSAAVFAQPAEVTEPDKEAAKLASALHLPATQVRKQLRSHKPFVYVARNIPQPLAKTVDALGLRGIGTEEEPTGVRINPQVRVASTVIGFTGVDNQGLAGIEFAFNDVLRGKPGKVVEDTDNGGRPLPFGRHVVEPAVVGDTVALTLDRTLQFESEEILRSYIKRFDAEEGSVVIMSVQTGEVLVLADYPNFDPKVYWHSPASSWRSRAISDPFEPGSTFKLVTATAALDSGKVSPDDTFPALNALTVGARVIHNADDGLLASGHGNETLDDIVAFSHNVGAAQAALRVGKVTMYDYIRRFGFDTVTGIDLSGESPGIVGSPDEWWGSRLATIGFGQGVSVTPLALARAYCAVANGGLLVRPLIVREIRNPSGKVLQRYRPEIVRRVMTPRTAAQLMSMLKDTVQHGTASHIKIPGYSFAGKTGTAQLVIDGSYVPGAYASSFVGIVPADKPQYVVLVIIERPKAGYYASVVAAPAFRDLARRLIWREGLLPTDSAQDRSPALQGNPRWRR